MLPIVCSPLLGEGGFNQKCVFLQEVCVNLAMPLGIGAGALVLAIGLLSILFYKCYIEVRPDGGREAVHLSGYDKMLLYS